MQKPAGRNFASSKNGRNARAGVPIMMTILYRPMVKEALGSHHLRRARHHDLQPGLCRAALRCRPGCSDGLDRFRAGQSQYQLAPMSKDEGRQMLLSMLHGQVPLAMPTPAAGR